MTDEQIEAGRKELAEARSIDAILKTEIGRVAAQAPGVLDSMRKQAHHIGETLSPEFHEAPPETK